ncbi:PREDICTED: uncharacterized protein LOC104817418 [Tarenaya hassleriana]|uniref:uncharacterized protein LOC104817418 n=1 Tax=Tarenaya hassleriana TaxID=28532 RepID=UPI00053C0B1B|nr:PREDICTED: uncharacterized protein LOC104817418 [Tarenaya hassleriana]XP_019058504.1 PREDICTED: uncharacterized protein LOC104817418 [Tarenaya hassleriana]
MGLFLLVIFSLSLPCLHATSQPIVSEESDFECVDIYNQPAFRHPLLKNHKIQTKYHTTSIDVNKENTQSSFFSKLEALCPEGQVPIHKSNFENQSYRTMSSKILGHHFAVLETREDSKTLYKGASAVMSIHAPRVPEKYMFSRGSLWVESGPTDELNSIQFGWASQPVIYKDDRPRLTAFWTADGYKQKGCYNEICPGFVQTHKTIYVGMRLYWDYIPVRFSIVQDGGVRGNWLLVCENQTVGYWPNELFTHLKDGATSLTYGGNVGQSPNGALPAMGNGTFPPDRAADYKKSAFFAHCEYSTEQSNGMVSIDSAQMKVVTDLPSCYKINYFQNQVPEMGQMFAYGGDCGK